MNYTTEQPTEKGRYWLRESGPSGYRFVGIVEVYDTGNGEAEGVPSDLGYSYTDGFRWEDGFVSDPNLEWAGPIPMPQN